MEPDACHDTREGPESTSQRLQPDRQTSPGLISRPRDRFKGARCHADNWLYTCRGSRLTEASGRADPLWIVCLRSLLRNIDKVTSQHIEAIPIRLRQLMWERIRAAELDSVAVWCLFAPISGSNKGIGLVKTARFIIDSGHGDRRDGNLELYTRRLSSPKQLWLMNLTVMSIECSATDLAAIARLTNLKALTIYAVPNVDNRTIRAWSRLASGIDTTDTPPLYFQKLKTLVLMCLKGITEDVFDYLAGFPELSLFAAFNNGMARPPKRDQKNDQRAPSGWKRCRYWDIAKSLREDEGPCYMSQNATLSPVLCFQIDAKPASSIAYIIQALGIEPDWYVRDPSRKAESVPQSGESEPLISMNDGHKDNNNESSARTHRVIKPSQRKRKREDFALSID